MSTIMSISSTPNPGAELRKLRKSIEQNDFIKCHNTTIHASPTLIGSSLSSSASSSNTSIMSAVDSASFSDGEDEFEDLSEFMDPLKSSSGSFFVHKVDVALAPPGQLRKYESLAALIKLSDEDLFSHTRRSELCINRRRRQVEVVDLTDIRNFYKLVWDFVMDEKKHMMLARVNRGEITPWQFVKHYGKETHFDESLRQLTDWSQFERIFPEWPFPSCMDMGGELGGDRWYSIVSPTYGRGRIYPEISVKKMSL